MLIYAQAFLLALFGCLATNIDNILLVLASGKRELAGHSALIFLSVLSVVILLGLLLSMGIDLAIPRHIAWVGLIPMTMGIYELTPMSRNENAKAGKASNVLALALPLAANSMDTLLVQTVLFSDLASAYHAVALIGAFAAAMLMAALVWQVMRHPGASERLLPLASKVRPWLLIIVGLLILSDTPWDTE